MYTVERLTYPNLFKIHLILYKSLLTLLRQMLHNCVASIDQTLQNEFGFSIENKSVMFCKPICRLH